jgi:hypothetical protein
MSGSFFYGGQWVVFSIAILATTFSLEFSFPYCSTHMLATVLGDIAEGRF